MPPYLPDPGTSRPPPVWLVRLLSALVGIGVLIIAVFLGGVILVTGVVVGLGLWGWLWWQRRKVMRMMQQNGGIDPSQFGVGPGVGGRRGGGPGIGGFGRSAAGPSTGRSAGHGDAAGQDDDIIEGDYEVVDDDRQRHRPPR